MRVETQKPLEVLDRVQRISGRAAARGAAFKKAIAYVGLTFFALLAFAPFYYMFLLSLDAKSGFAALDWPPNLVPDWRWSNYVNSLGRQPFGRYFVNAGIVTTLSVLGTIISSAAVGYSFARLPLPFKSVLFVILLATLMVPGQVTLIPQFILFKRLGWYDTWFPLWVPHWTGSAFAIFLYRQYFMTLPSELEDAASIDGANPFTTFWRIFVPLSKPIIATIAILVFVGSWNDLLGPVIYLQTQEKYTLPVALAYFQSYSSGIDITGMMSASFVAVIPPIALFAIMQRYFVQGVVLTGLKQ